MSSRQLQKGTSPLLCDNFKSFSQPYCPDRSGFLDASDSPLETDLAYFQELEVCVSFTALKTQG